MEKKTWSRTYSNNAINAGIVYAMELKNQKLMR